MPEWPREYGGGGLTRDETKILRQEMRALDCRSPLDSFGIWMLGPALLKYGSEEQKREHLPKIARGEIRWCQGYSEPGAGSDLASLQTRAEDKGDQFLVNGSKIWTSYADKADWIFCLVRTDPNAPKHEGISFLLFDMESAGVSTEPITLISGASPFCQTFFDDVLVPKANLVGKLNKGWDIAKYLLTHERDMIGGMGSTADNRSLGQIATETVGTENGILADSVLRGQIAAFEIDALAFRLTMDRVGDMAKVGTGASGCIVAAEILRHRAQQAPDGVGDVGGRYGRARMGRRALARRPHRSRVAALQGQLDRGRHQRGSAEHHRRAIRALPRASQLISCTRARRATAGLDKLVLNDEQTMLRDNARGFLAKNAPVAHLRELRDNRDADGILAPALEELCRDGAGPGILVAARATADPGLGSRRSRRCDGGTGTHADALPFSLHRGSRGDCDRARG